MQEVLEPPHDETDNNDFYNIRAIPPIKDVKETTLSWTTHSLDDNDQKDKTLKDDRIEFTLHDVDDKDVEGITTSETEPEPTDCDYCAEVQEVIFEEKFLILRHWTSNDL